MALSFTRLVANNIFRSNIRLNATANFKFKGLDVLGLEKALEKDMHSFKKGVPISNEVFYPDNLGGSVRTERFQEILDLCHFPKPTAPRMIDVHSSEKRPHLFFNDEGPTAPIACICEPRENTPNYLILRKGLAKRCYCGHWFKLVNKEEYFNTLYERREESYNEIKDAPLMKKLEKEYDEAVNRFEELLDKSYEICESDPFGPVDLREEMKVAWEEKCLAFNKCTALLDLPKEKRPNLEVLEDFKIPQLE